MSAQADPMRAAIVAFCAQVGADPLLVQGAGGNVSWKDGDTLWIKASGTWLVQAAEKEIFVPVDLSALGTALAAGDFSVTPAVRGESTLRPSIETLLHALMPQPVVVHVHAVEVLAHLVRADWTDSLRAHLDPALRWAAVPYRKPGAELAEAVSQALAGTGAQVVFLQNHGVVIGAADPAEVSAILAQLTTALRSPAAPAAPAPARPLQLGDASYQPVDDSQVQALAMDPALFARLPTQWALYPDHVVFLGASAHAFDDVDSLAQALAGATSPPELVFVRGVGVFALPAFGLARQVQLRCYADVVARLPANVAAHALGMDDIAALLNWDAEHYRMNLAKQK